MSIFLTRPRLYRTALLCAALSSPSMFATTTTTTTTTTTATATATVDSCSADTLITQADTAAHPPPAPPLANTEVARINAALAVANTEQRVAALHDVLSTLAASPALNPELSPAPSAAALAAEQQYLRGYVALALAQAYADAAQTAAAIRTAKTIALDSPHAPAALLLIGQLYAQEKDLKNAQHWLVTLADFFPESPQSIHGLLLAATAPNAAPADALALAQRAVNLANENLTQAQWWQEQSQRADFLTQVNSAKIPLGLWRVAYKALSAATFEQADNAQKNARHALLCMAQIESHFAQQQLKTPLLISQLSEMAAVLDAQLEQAGSNVREQEIIFSKAEEKLKHCKNKKENAEKSCTEEKIFRDAVGKNLTAWRNRVRDMQQQPAYFQQQKNAILAGLKSQAKKESGALAFIFYQQRRESSGQMQRLLADAIGNYLAQWQALAAQAHVALAEVQAASLPRHPSP